MGADGGVGWVTLRDGKTSADLRVLLMPWWSSLTYIGGSDFAEDSRNAFIREHRIRNAVYGGYGTDKDGPSFAYDNFGTVARAVDECRDNGSVTFGDIIMSLYTCPYWTAGYDCGMPDDWLDEFLRPVHPSGCYYDTWVNRHWRSRFLNEFQQLSWETDIEPKLLSGPLASFYAMRIDDWFVELSKTVEGAWVDGYYVIDVDYRETWT